MDCFYIVKVKWSKAIYKWMDGMESLNAQMLCSANKSIKNRGYLTFIIIIIIILHFASGTFLSFALPCSPSLAMLCGLVLWSLFIICQ